MDVMITVVGNVVDDPEPGATRAGAPFAAFRAVSTARRFDRQTGMWSAGSSLHLKVLCWGPLARNVLAALHKGAPVVVHGRLRSRTVAHETSEGQEPRVHNELHATAVGFDLSRSAVAAVGAADGPAAA